MKMFQCFEFSLLLFSTQTGCQKPSTSCSKDYVIHSYQISLNTSVSAMIFPCHLFLDIYHSHTIHHLVLEMIYIFLFFFKPFRSSVKRSKITNVSFASKLADSWVYSWQAIQSVKQGTNMYDDRIYTMNFSIKLVEVEEQFMCSYTSATTFILRRQITIIISSLLWKSCVAFYYGMTSSIQNI